MNALVITPLSASAISSATGMILFRYGGRGNTAITELTATSCMQVHFPQ
jgi:hypothetical protein